MSDYQKRKENAKTAVYNIMYDTAEANLSYGELAEIYAKIEKLAFRYGLKKHFKNEGIL